MKVMGRAHDCLCSFVELFLITEGSMQKNKAMEASEGPLKLMLAK